MSADLLRKAAEQVRADSREDITVLLATAGNALADWLDASAQEVDNTTDVMGGDESWINPDWAGLVFARLIVGEDA